MKYWILYLQKATKLNIRAYTMQNETNLHTQALMIHKYKLIKNCRSMQVT